MPETLVKRPIVLSIPAPIEKKRIRSLDILRGAIMLLMALDHVRDFFHIHAFDSDPTDLATTTPVLFFTRWITHFCAPVFIFLSGLSAFLSGQTKTRKVLSAHLIKRGLFLVLLECSVITFSLSFNPKYDMFFLQVIWAIGWSMVILGLLVRTSMTWIVIVGTAILLGHNIMDYPPLHQLVRENIAVNVLLTARFTAYHVGDSTVLAMYPILPWTALMLLGYGCGYFFQRKISGKARRKILLGTGVACLVAFVVLRLFNGYGDPVSWSAQKNILFTAMSFLNVTKYPVSLQYCLLTLSPAFLLLAVTENSNTNLSRFMTVYGRTPLFYYILHFYLMHLLCVACFFLSGYGIGDIPKGSDSLLLFFRPVHFGYALIVVYGIWLFVIGALYRPCQWYYRYKTSHSYWWLKYL